MPNRLTWLVTGDIHGSTKNIRTFLKQNPQYDNEETAIIVLGDAGLNYFGDMRDFYEKNAFHKNHKCWLYCLRGNHEMRPDDVPGMELVVDANISACSYMETTFPRIRYFNDVDIVWLNQYRVALVGGAYSVDKGFRLATGRKWFENEQLSEVEMVNAIKFFEGESVDFVLTHTCPLDFQPTDLFMDCIDQETVDNKTEKFLQTLKDNVFCDYRVWLFGHYHADRIEQPYVEQYFERFDLLDDIYNRWVIDYPQDNNLEKFWYIPRGAKWYDYNR